MGGVSLSINSYVSYSDGLEMSMFMNSNYQYSGVQLAIFGNRAVEVAFNLVCLIVARIAGEFKLGFSTGWEIGFHH